MTATNGSPNTMFIYKGDVKEGESVIPAELHPDVLDAIPERFHGETLFYKTDSVEIDCLEYISGAALLVLENEEEGPIFGLICEILCCAHDDTKLFVLDIMEMDVYNELFNSYEVCMMRTNVQVEEFSTLKNKWPLLIYCSHTGKMLITNRASSCVLPY